MSSPSDDNAAVSAEMPSADGVAAYLKANPAFFADYPDVLHALEIRHASGDAASLLERQLASLRDENRRLKARFHEFVDLAQSNQQLINRIHQLALALMEAAGPRAIFATLGTDLKREFNAERVRTLVFAHPAFIESPPVPEFVGPDPDVQALFATTLAAGQPHCGELAADQFTWLFPDTEHRGSSVVLRLSGKAWTGLLVISSDDPDRFKHDMGTDFLAYLGDIVSLVIDPWMTRSDGA